MRSKCATEAEIARLATRQHGVLSRRQLLDLGLSKAAISRRLQSSRLHRLHQGVYALGHRALSDESRWMAAVLACGAGAVLSHRSAARLWGLLPRVEVSAERVDVSIPSAAGRRRRRGIHLRRRPALAAADVTELRGVPVTSPARTLADLRRVATAAELRRAVRQAEVLGLEVGMEPRTQPTRSELEALFLALCRRARLPDPEVNRRIARLEVDFLWRRQRLVVETDGYLFHRGRAAFERDKDRDLVLRAAGYDVIHFSYRQLTEEAEICMKITAEALAAPRR